MTTETRLAQIRVHYGKDIIEIDKVPTPILGSELKALICREFELKEDAVKVMHIDGDDVFVGDDWDHTIDLPRKGKINVSNWEFYEPA
jgi:hypothetical protein